MLPYLTSRLHCNVHIKLELFIALEGFTLPSLFVVKELTVLYPNRDFRHFLFEKPIDFTPTEKDCTTIRFITKKLSQLVFTEGEIPYNCIGSILQRYKNHTIYTYSDIAKSTLQNYLPTARIINTQILGHQLPKTLAKQNCFKNHNPRYCSLSKAIEVRKFVENEVYT